MTPTASFRCISSIVATFLVLQLNAAFGVNGARVQQEAKQQPRQHVLTKSCVPRVESVLYTREGMFTLGTANPISNISPKWPGSDNAPFSEHIQAVLHSANNADFDGLNGPCRPAASNVAQVKLNDDGLNLAKFIAKIDELLKFSADDEQELIQADLPTVTIAMSDADHMLHAFLGDGRDQSDLGALVTRPIPMEADPDSTDRITLQFSESDGSNHAVLALGNDQKSQATLAADKGAFASPVPEPRRWMMFVAGLAALGFLSYGKWKPTIKLPETHTELFQTSFAAIPQRRYGAASGSPMNKPWAGQATLFQ